MLTVVCWKWRSNGYRHRFTAAAVETLRAMVARHYNAPHRFLCITDDPVGLSCETLPLWDDFAHLRNASGEQFPSCYRRLKMFAPDMAAVLGPRVVSIDLDVAIVGDVTALWSRGEDLVTWRPRPKQRPQQINGSLLLFSPGGRLTRLWQDFDPARSPKAAIAAGFIGSDQGWISHCLRGEFASWTKADGVHRYGEVRNEPGRVLPNDARIVFFTGPRKPWDPMTQREAGWIKDHWNAREAQKAVA